MIPSLFLSKFSLHNAGVDFVVGNDLDVVDIPLRPFVVVVGPWPLVVVVIMMFSFEVDDFFMLMLKFCSIGELLNIYQRIFHSIIYIFLYRIFNYITIRFILNNNNNL